MLHLPAGCFKSAIPKRKAEFICDRGHFRPCIPVLVFSSESKRDRGNGLKFSFRKKNQTFFEQHGLTIVTVSILLLWIVLYSISDEKRHIGSFFGNAIADWSGVVVMVLATKHMYERGSKESKNPPKELHHRVLHVLREHSLTVFLLATGTAWLVLYAHADSESKWGQVVGNIVSEWTQIIGMVLLTKKLVETGSKESKDDK
jgi:Na+/H+-translocating membrane pyrophosphatase